VEESSGLTAQQLEEFQHC